jgi:hypothetical protein
LLTDLAGAKIVFLTFRQQTQTLQGVLVISGEKDEHQVSKQMLKFAQLIPVRQSLPSFIHLSSVSPGSISRVAGLPALDRSCQRIADAGVV